MNRVLSAMAGGATGITIMSLLLLLLEVETREQIQAFDAVARFVGLPGNTFFGFVIFALAGIIAWPILFVALESSLPFEDPPSKGMVLGIALWVAFFILGRGDISGPLLVIFGGLTLISHVAYGFVLGAVYNHLSRPVESAGELAADVDHG